LASPPDRDDRGGPLVPALPPSSPRWGNQATRAIGRLGLRVLRFRVAGSVPDVRKLVAVAAPHTSAMDVFVGLAVLLALGVRVHWLGKHTIFREPLGTVLRWLGGIPVDRRTAGGLVGRAVALVQAEDTIYLALAPEGTRRKVRRWKTGFHRIAVETGVPLLPVALDYRLRTVRIFPLVRATGEYGTDLARIKAHFSADMARHPERF
jgi:1-acyl-sn-glycerol-3-phosphate acyltransferase